MKKKRKYPTEVKDRLWLSMEKALVHWFNKQPRRGAQSVAWSLIVMVRKFDAQIRKVEIKDSYDEGFKDAKEIYE